MSIWFTYLLQPLINLLIFAYEIFGNNLGFAIIVLTAGVRLLIMPMTNKSMQNASKMQALKPELDALKEKYGKDKQALAQAQMDLYKKNNINPAGGLMPMILQFILVIALFQAFNKVLALPNIGELNTILYQPLKLANDAIINTKFFYLDLVKPDVITIDNPVNLGFFTISILPGFFLILAAVGQFFSSKLMMSKNSIKKQQTNLSAKNKKNSQTDAMMDMQKQMIYLMPFLTLFIGLKFPSGLVLYWITFSAMMLFQQLYTKDKSDKLNKVKNHKP